MNCMVHTEEMIKMRRNLRDNDYRSSKTKAGGSVSNKCHSKSYTTYISDESSPPCIKCDINNVYCYSCTKTRHCTRSNGSPWRCIVNEKCCLIAKDLSDANSIHISVEHFYILPFWVGILCIILSALINKNKIKNHMYN